MLRLVLQLRAWLIYLIGFVVFAMIANAFVGDTRIVGDISLYYLVAGGIALLVYYGQKRQQRRPNNS